MSDPVEVNVGECRCPGTPHPFDLVYLRPKMGYTGGAVLQGEMSEYLSTPVAERGGWVKLNARLKALYLEEGIVGWNLVDEDGPLAVNVGNIRERFLEDFAAADQVTVIADKADGLYYEAVLAPLVARLLESSQPTPTSESTSVTPNTDPTTKRSPSTAPSRTPRKRSKRSSTTTSQTGVTVTTSPSPVFVSSSSQS